VAAQAVVLSIVTARSYFQKDDFPNFAFARGQSLSWEYLSTPVFQHFAPGHRLGNLVVERFVFPHHAPVIAALVAGAVGISLLVFAIARALWGPRWWTVWLLAVTGLPLLLVPSLLWLASGLHVLPSLLAVLTAILAYLHWLADRRPRWLALIVAAFAIGLLFYVKTLFLLAYLPLIRLLFLEERLSPRRAVSALWADRAVYVALAVPAVVYVAYYLQGDFNGAVERAPAEDIQTYLRIAWLRGFVPGLFGWRVPEVASALDDAVVALGQLALLAAVVVSIARKRSAWRGWAFLLFVFVLSSVVAGVPRLPLLGVRIGYDLRYYAETAVLVPLALALAFTRPRVAPLALRDGAGGGARGGGGSRRGWLAAVGVVSVLLLTTSFAEGSRRLNVEYLGDDAQAYMAKVQTGLAAVRRVPGATVLDGQLPESIVDLASPPFDRRSIMFPIIAPPAPAFGLGERIYDVGLDGVVYPVRFQADAVLGRTRCDGARGGTLDVAVPPLAPANQRYLVLDVRVSRPGTAGVQIDTGRGLGPAPAAQVPLVAGQRRAVVDLPLFVPTNRVQVALPPGACATSVTIGTFPAA